MTRRSFYAILLMLPAILAACSDNDSLTADTPAALGITVGVDGLSTRGTAVTGFTTASIGVSLTDAGGVTYDGTPYTNVRYSTTDGTAWSVSGDSPMLSSTPATLHAYYPYSSSVTDVSSIPISSGETDYMYSTKTTADNESSDVALTMSHAMAVIRLVINRDETFSGSGTVKRVSLQCDDIYTDAVLDARTGRLSALSGRGGTITASESFTLSTTQQVIDLMVVPSRLEGDLHVSLSLDGEQYAVDISTDYILYAGKYYTYNLTFTDIGLRISSVTVNDYVQSLPDIGGFLEEYTEMVELVYDVTSTTSNTTLLSSSSSFQISSVSEMYIDGVQVTPVKTYKFSTVGEHKVHVKFSDVTAIPAYAFSGVSIKSIIMPKSLEKIGTNGIQFIKVTKVEFVANLTPDWNGKLFYSSSSYCQIIVPETVREEFLTFYFNTDTNNHAIVTCDSDIEIDGVYYTADMKTLIGCAGRLEGEFTVPDGVTTIRQGAFSRCGLTHVVIPASVTDIEKYAFSYCSSLKQITSHATVAPVITNYTFDSAYNGGILNVPDGYADAYASWMGTSSYYLGYLNWICLEGISVLVDGFYYSQDMKTILKATEDITGDVVIPDGVTTIGANAFYNNTAITSVTIPASVTSIGKKAFSSCSNISSVTVLSTVPATLGTDVWHYIKEDGVLNVPEGCRNTYITKWFSNGGNGGMQRKGWTCMDGSEILVDGVYYTSDMLSLVKCPKELTGTVTVPAGVKYINNNAFYKCQSLSGISLPEGLLHIDDFAFQSLTLGSLVIPNSVLNIGIRIFYYAKINELTLGTGLVYFGGSCFEYFKGTSIKSLAKVPLTIDSGTFRDIYRDGILKVPAGCTDAYSTWMSTSSYYLGYYGWTIEEFTE